MTVNPDVLNDIIRILQKDLDTEETFKAVINIIERVIEFNSATLYLYKKEDKKLEIMYQTGEEPVELAGEMAFGIGSGISGYMASQKKPIILQSLEKSRAGKEKLFNSFVSLPLWVGEKFIGVLNLGHLTPNAYQRSEVETFEIIATQVSLVLEQIELRRELDRQNVILTKALNELHNAQKELIEKERLAAIGEIVVTVNHEINNPLTSIIGLAEIMNMSIQTTPAEKIQEALTIILNEAKRIKKVTHKLSGISSSTSEEYVGGTRMTKL